jgi:hypothetical protein
MHHSRYMLTIAFRTLHVNGITNPLVIHGIDATAESSKALGSSILKRIWQTWQGI